MKEKLYTVYAVNIESGERRVMAENKTEAQAEKYIEMCVMRRGVETEYFTSEEQK